MIRFPERRPRPWLAVATLSMLVATAGTAIAATAAGPQQPAPLRPVFSEPAAFDVSLPLRQLASQAPARKAQLAPSGEPIEIRPEPGPVVKDQGYSGDGALQGDSARLRGAAPTIAAPLTTFEGLSNQDNFDIFGFRVAPPDPVGAVGPSHYVEMINLVFGVYDKAGNLLVGPADTGALWAGFAVPDCTDPSGDPIVIYDKLEGRWLLTQFTTAGPTYYNCVAISVTGDPTGAYYRYAFSTGLNFPDYPKYGNWKKSYVITTREFGPTVEYGIGVYALEKNKMIAGNPNARMVSFFLDGNIPDILPLVGDGLLPADFDGTKQPKEDAAIPLVGTQDDGGGYGATFDALNIWDLKVKWNAHPTASLILAAQLPVASFDSIFPCGVGGGRRPRLSPAADGLGPDATFLDILSYRQRPTWRLAYRNFNSYEALVTNQSVEALPGVAGVRWYEIRRNGSTYSLYQQGTYAPNDGVHRWMGSIAQDKKGNMGLGYSVVNGVDVFPGIRYTGRLAGDPLGQMTQGEGTIINGTGVQMTINSRWGDYTSMNVDPTDDCTFWYVNEYYEVERSHRRQHRPLADPNRQLQAAGLLNGELVERVSELVNLFQGRREEPNFAPALFVTRAIQAPTVRSLTLGFRTEAKMPRVRLIGRV